LRQFLNFACILKTIISACSMPLLYSPLESKRFGLRILRGTATKLAPEEILHAIVEEQADVAILRIPTSEQYKLYQLSSVLPFPVIVADTVVSLECDLREFPPRPLRNSTLIARRATSADIAILEELVELSFKSYRTHYHSNPLFDSQLVLAGYKEWALSCLQPDDSRICFLFYLNEQAVSYSTIEQKPTYCEGILYGARPGITAKGIYFDMIQHTKEYVLDQGLKRILGITQVQNHAGQRAWVREGFVPVRSACTIHINALLQQPQLGARMLATI
jgi:hypothetical protein